MKLRRGAISIDRIANTKRSSPYEYLNGHIWKYDNLTFTWIWKWKISSCKHHPCITGPHHMSNDYLYFRISLSTLLWCPIGCEAWISSHEFYVLWAWTILSHHDNGLCGDPRTQHHSKAASIVLKLMKCYSTKRSNMLWNAGIERSSLASIVSLDLKCFTPSDIVFRIT